MYLDMECQVITEFIWHPLIEIEVYFTKVSTYFIIETSCIDWWLAWILKVYDWDLDYLVIPDGRSYIVVLTGYSYHFKELHCSAQCHTQMRMWIVSRGVVLILALWKVSRVLRGFLLHRSLINNSASLSNGFGEFYFSFKFGILGLLHQWSLQIAYIRGGKDSQREFL